MEALDEFFGKYGLILDYEQLSINYDRAGLGRRDPMDVARHPALKSFLFKSIFLIDDPSVFFTEEQYQLLRSKHIKLLDKYTNANNFECARLFCTFYNPSPSKIDFDFTFKRKPITKVSEELMGDQTFHEIIEILRPEWIIKKNFLDTEYIPSYLHSLFNDSIDKNSPYESFAEDVVKNLPSVLYSYKDSNQPFMKWLCFS